MLALFNENKLEKNSSAGGSQMTRKTFITISAAGAIGAVANIGSLFPKKHITLRGTVTSVRLSPIPGKNYPRYFLKLCANKKFQSVSEAVNAVKDRSLVFTFCRAPA